MTESKNVNNEKTYSFTEVKEVVRSHINKETSPLLQEVKLNQDLYIRRLQTVPLKGDIEINHYDVLLNTFLKLFTFATAALIATISIDESVVNLNFHTLRGVSIIILLISIIAVAKILMLRNSAQKEIRLNILEIEKQMFETYKIMLEIEKISSESYQERIIKDFKK